MTPRPIPKYLGLGPRVHGAHRHHEAQAVGGGHLTTAPGARQGDPGLRRDEARVRRAQGLVVQERHAGFRSLKEAVDTTTPAGRMMMQMVGAFAEFERAMLKERTKAGLDAARKEGRIGGRPPKLKPHQQQEIVTLVKQGKKTAADAARLFGVHPATVSRLLRRT